MQILAQPVTTETLFAQSANIIDGLFVKAVVDINRHLLAVDAGLHADLEQLLLQEGSRQQDLWGINIYPNVDLFYHGVEFDSLINIRPRDNNSDRFVHDPHVRSQIIEVVRQWLE